MGYEKPAPALKISVICFFLFSYCLLNSCATGKNASYDPSVKLPADKLKEDVKLLKKILESNHPGLYWYTSKDSVDSYFNNTIERISDSMTEAQFKNKLAWCISKINCGHTTVGPSRAYAAYIHKNHPPRFPLMLKAWGDSLVVLGSFNSRDSSILKRGTVITSVEHFSNRDLLDSMFQFISTDGHADNFKNQAVSFNFPRYYSYAFPLKDSFFIRYIDSAGQEHTMYTRLFIPEKDSAGNAGSAYEKKQPLKRQDRLNAKRKFTYDTVNNLANMRLATFSSGRLQSFFRQSFRTLNDNHIPNLVIDLRQNTGGKISLSAKLSRYLKDKPFHIADTVAAISRSLPYGKYIKPSFPFRFAMRVTTRKKQDGKFHFSSLENYTYKPEKKLHYKGNIYIIQGGYTFSAAAMFVSNMKGQSNVVVAGEETGGGNYGTSAVHLPTIILPNSKIVVVLPLYRVVQNRNNPKDGRGVQPDVVILPSSTAIKDGVDIKLIKIKELIQADTHKED